MIAAAITKLRLRYLFVMAQVLRRVLRRTNDSGIVRIYPIGCTHLGAAAADEKRLEEYVERVEKDKDGYWIGMGDYGDYINRNDRRFNAECISPWLRPYLNDITRVQTKRVLSYLEPIAGKCLGLAEGNHERTQTNHYERNVFLDIVDGVKRAAGHPDDFPLSMGYTGWIYLTVPKALDGNTKRGTYNLRINCHHGSGGASTRSGRLTKLEKYAMLVDADLVLVGHMHDVQKIPIHMRTIKGEYEKTVPKWAALTGTFLDARNPDGYVTYGEEKMYAPLPPSNIVIEWRSTNRDPYKAIKIMEEW